MPPQNPPYSPPQYGDGSINQMSAEVGRLSAHVENLQREVMDGNDGRRRIYEKLEANTRITEKTQSCIELLRKEITESILPVIKDYTKHKNRIIGALTAVTFIGGLIGWGLTEVRGWVTDYYVVAAHPPAPPLKR